jgi:segregation and condensation protein B
MELKAILEAVLFSSQKPLNARELRELLTKTAEESEESITKSFKKLKESELESTLEALAKETEVLARSYRLVCVAGAWQFVTQPDYGPWLKTLVGEKNRPSRLSQPALETLAIIAYRQPVTRAEVEQIRGVNVDGTMQTLLERGLVEQAGRAEVVGRPSLYATTPLFLEYFGLAGLDGLPAADELRRIVVQRPEALATAEAGLATVPPEQLSLEQVEAQKANETAPAAPAAS